MFRPLTFKMEKKKKVIVSLELSHQRQQSWYLFYNINYFLFFIFLKTKFTQNAQHLAVFETQSKL